MYRKYLEKAGCQVRWTKSAEGFEEEAARFHADIIILDQTIAGEDKTGMDLIPPLRKKFPQAKIVMTSNHSDFEMRKAALQAGAKDYLVKMETSPRRLAEYVSRLGA